MTKDEIIAALKTVFISLFFTLFIFQPADGYTLLFRETFFYLKAMIIAAVFLGVFFFFERTPGLIRSGSGTGNLVSLLVILAAVILVIPAGVFKGLSPLINVVHKLLPAAALIAYFYGVRFASGENRKGAQITAVILSCFICISVFIATYSYHQSYYTQAKDTGIYINALWQIADNGSEFTCFEGYVDHRAVHFQPIMRLYAPLFKFFCPDWLLFFSQSFFLALSGYFIFLLAQRILNDGTAAFYVMLAYCVSPYFIRMADYNFHFSTLYAAAFAAFLYFSEDKKFFPALLAAALAAMVKEECAVYITLAAIFAALRNRDIRYSALAVAAGLYAFIAIKLIIPAYSDTGAGFEQNIFTYAADIKRYTSPVIILQLALFLSGFMLLPFMHAPAFLLLFMPPVIIQLVYNRPEMLLFGWYHSAVVFPAGVAAALYASEKLSKYRENFPAAALIALAVQVQLSMVFTPPKGIIVMCAVYVLLIIAVYFSAGTGVRLKYAVFAAAIGLVFAAGYIAHNNYRLNLVDQKAKEAITMAIKLLPKDPEIPVISNINIAPHVSCRRFCDFLENDNETSVFRGIMLGRAREFYLLAYMNSFTYQEQNPFSINTKIYILAKKLGFSAKTVFSEQNVYLIRFMKQKGLYRTPY